jgi:hypothetical protein
MADGYINQGELLEFELDLENRLQKIEQQFRKGRYKLQPLRPVPRPKKLQDDGQCVDRQYYHIAVDDQIAWIAVVNALGPDLDDKMPAWSYGNRLYRAAWYEEEKKESKLEIGPYRHASGYLYKKFQHSWPLFRKHISLTARTMARPIKKMEESESDQRAIEAASTEGLPYLENDFWNRPQNNSTNLYYASIDLKQFYPSIHAEKILAGLLLAQNSSDAEGKFEALLSSMLKFTLDKSDISAPVLENVEPAFKGKSVKGLPTGLFAAGFLANAAMLPVDKIVDEKIQTDKTVAHFRFVDDHTILTYDFEKLCEWIEWYKQLVFEQLGIKLNENKSDPESLSEWLTISKTLSDTNRVKKKKETKERKAKADCKIDGSNPTKLLTQTLEKVSIIAGQNTDVLDDHDLKDRLKDLEWLLRADIPEREIRPDTRAAFAAGQIATLAPMLIQGADGIVDTHRELVKMERELKTLGEYPEQNGKKLQALTAQYKRQLERFNEKETKLVHEEKGHLTRCFGLLILAMKEHPGKARLFFRLHQYCLLTGHHGLGQIIEWIDGLREQGASVWADYYSSLTLQILAQNILKAIRVCTTPASLRSDQEAANRHLEDITSIEQKFFNPSGANESWFHKMARREYTVSVAIAVEYLKQSGLESMSSKFAEVAKFYGAPALRDSSSVWFEKTGYSAGNWAYLAEHHLRTDSHYTGLWEVFGRGFDYGKISDQLAIRLYPEALPQKAWEYLVSSKSSSREDDSGWIYDILKNKPEWIKETKKVRKTAFMRAVRVLEAEPKTHISIAEWTKYINSDDCSPFDPRKSEWTALEIIRQIIEPTLEVGAASIPLERIHPQNILIPREWMTIPENGPHLSWEKWRSHIDKSPPIKFAESEHSLLDYRYHSHKDFADDIWLKRENQFGAVGRLLLGLLCGNHDAPIEWNIRGNERVLDIPRARVFRSLAISSPTLLLIEGCIDPRSAESRLIAKLPDLFGLEDGVSANDTQYDPPLLKDVNDLVAAILNAQDILSQNQLTVSMHQPRQLIPFRLSDFAVATGGEPEEDVDA